MNTTFVIIGFGILVIIGGISYAAWMMFNPTRSASDRLSDLTGGPKEEERDVIGEKIAERLATLASPQDEEEKDVLKHRLAQAGFKSKVAPQLFNAVRVSAALLMPIILAPMAIGQSTSVMAMIVMIGVAGGYYIPLIYVNSIITTRQQKILKPLPDALDLLVTSVEAGLGLDAAFRRVASEIEGAAPELAFEFQLVNHEIGAGISRMDALKRLADRTGLDEIKSLVNMLVQAERFGTSIARSLRVHSETNRQKRMSAAEEKAAQVSPKLTIVMILFFMPCLGSVLLGPAVIKVLNSGMMD